LYARGAEGVGLVPSDRCAANRAATSRGAREDQSTERSIGRRRLAEDRVEAFSFAKTFDGIDVEKIIWPELSKAIESVQGLGLPKSYGATIAEALRARPSVEPGEFTPQVEATAEEAIVLAGDDDVAEIVDDETVVARIAGMSPEKRRALALDVLVLVGACVVLAAWLAQADLKDPRGAGIALAWAASLIRVYWRLNDKL
jgi:hypothetical protein